MSTKHTGRYPVRLKMTRQEFDHVLAGLRLLQRSLEWSSDGAKLPPGIRQIVTNDGKHEPLSSEELDGFCELINTGGRDV